MMNQILIALESQDSMTESLKFNLKAYLDDYLSFLEKEPSLKGKFTENTLT